MAISDVVKDVCLAVGVAKPQGSVFPASIADRTLEEMISLANEMAMRIAYNTRDWTMLRRRAAILSTGIADPAGENETRIPLPTDFLRLLKTSNIFQGSDTLPMQFVSDPDEWLVGQGGYGRGQWMIEGRDLIVRPLTEANTPYRFNYIANNAIALTGGGYGNRFQTDTDVFTLGDRLLTLGMIWQWKANKGGQYVENMQNYEDALAYGMASDKPSPVIIGNRTFAAGAPDVAYPWPVQVP